MRVLVTVSASQPELLADLEKLDPRHRAERIRTLAFSALKAHKKSEIEKAIKHSERPDDNVEAALSQGLKGLENL